MPKRDTVNVNCPEILMLIQKNEWNRSSFSRKVGRYDSWFSEVLRGKNLPSPDEAVKMCLVLEKTPEEILLHEGKDEKETAKCQKDIELVRKLLEKEKGIKKNPDPKAEGVKKAPATEGEGYTELQKAAIQFVLSLPPEKLERFIKMGRAAFEEDQ